MRIKNITIATSLAAFLLVVSTTTAFAQLPDFNISFDETESVTVGDPDWAAASFYAGASFEATALQMEAGATIGASATVLGQTLNVISLSAFAEAGVDVGELERPEWMSATVPGLSAGIEVQLFGVTVYNPTITVEPCVEHTVEQDLAGASVTFLAGPIPITFSATLTASVNFKVCFLFNVGAKGTELGLGVSIVPALDVVLEGSAGVECLATVGVRGTVTLIKFTLAGQVLGGLCGLRMEIGLSVNAFDFTLSLFGVTGCIGIPFTSFCECLVDVEVDIFTIDGLGEDFVLFDEPLIEWDFIAPAVTSCPDVTVEMEQSCGMPVTSSTMSPYYASFTASDICDDSLTLTHTPSTGLFNLGTNTVNFQARDDANLTDSCSAVVTVEDTTAPTIVLATATTPHDEAAPTTWVTARGSDPHCSAHDLTYRVDWNDPNDPGATSTATRDQSGNFTATHTYCADGTYSPTLTITDARGNASTQVLSVTVNNVSPTITSTAISTPVGESATMSASFSATDQGCDDTILEYRIDWNDFSLPGATSTGTTAWNSTVTRTHVYCQDGVYHPKVTVTDSDGATDTYTYTIVVFNVPPTLDVSGLNGTFVDENTQLVFGIAPHVSPKWFDQGVCDPHNVTIDWADIHTPLVEPGVVNVTRSGLPAGSTDGQEGDIGGAHTWELPQRARVSIRLCDDDDCVTKIAVVTVQDAAPPRVVISYPNATNEGLCRVTNNVVPIWGIAHDDHNNFPTDFNHIAPTPNNFDRYNLEFRPVEGGAWVSITGDVSEQLNVTGLLGEWDTSAVTTGRYMLRLTAWEVVKADQTTKINISQTTEPIEVFSADPDNNGGASELFNDTGLQGIGHTAKFAIQPAYVVVTAGGDVYFTDRNNHRVQRMNADGSAQRIVAPIGPGQSVENYLNSPEGIDLDEETDVLYVADRNNDRIIKIPNASACGFNPTEEPFGDTIVGKNCNNDIVTFIDNLNKPMGIHLDADGNLWVADTNNGTVLRFDDGGDATLAITGLDSPAGVDFVDPEGALYVAVAGASVVKQYEVADGEAVFIRDIGLGVLDKPEDVVAGRDGYTYVSDRNSDLVRKFDPMTGLAASFGIDANKAMGNFNKPGGIYLRTTGVVGSLTDTLWMVSSNNARIWTVSN